jgi:hypothetical protein
MPFMGRVTQLSIVPAHASKRKITVQPTYPQSHGNFDRKPETMQVWVSYDLPWTDRNTADDALAQALGFLKDRCQ